MGTKEEILLGTHDSRVNSVAFSPDSKYALSGSDDEKIKLWKIETKEEILLGTHDGVVSSVSFSPDGKYALSGGHDN